MKDKQYPLDESRFTICTVSYGHAAHLLLNLQVCRRLNGTATDRVDWLVAENGPDGLDNRMVNTTAPFRLFAGSSNTILGASYHHADALNQLLTGVRTRFLLVLDPDFYILRCNWINDIEQYMRSHGLAFFGVPWHPRYVENYRYFPAVHCMFIDRSYVSLEEVDFRPEVSSSEGSMDRVGWQFNKPTSSYAMKLLFWLRLAHRWRQPWDTGVRLYRRFADQSESPSECVIPVFRVSSEWQRSLRSRIIEAFLPDKLCYVPKRPNTFTEVGFRERGFFQGEIPKIWEEFIWKDKPFGLHMRRSYGMHRRDPSSEFEHLRTVLDGCLAYVGTQAQSSVANTLSG